MASPAELDVASLLSVRQAIDILDAEPVSPRVIRLPLSKCRGYRLAQDVLADRDAPPFDKSIMDGYAVRAGDVTRTPAELSVVGEVPAGTMPERGIGPGETMAVMTGAPIPPGTEAVVPVEQTQELAAPDEMRGRVKILKGVNPGYAIAKRGSDVRAGHLVLPGGTLLDAPAIAVAAAVGAAVLDVFARPRVAVLGTGDEIVPIDQPPEAWQIRNSNNVMLMALLERLGCEATDLGIVADDPGAIRAAIEQGLTFDAFFVTGGMSMGNYDYVPRILAELGVGLKISKVKVKPGKPFVFGVKGESDGRKAFVFGLPGNPVAAYVCTLRLASRVLNRIAGGPPTERWLSGRLENGLPANGPREFYQPVIRRPPAAHKSAHNEMPAIEVLAWQGSADIFTLARANALLVRSENEPSLPKGTMVRVLEI